MTTSVTGTLLVIRPAPMPATTAHTTAADCSRSPPAGERRRDAGDTSHARGRTPTVFRLRHPGEPQNSSPRPSASTARWIAPNADRAARPPRSCEEVSARRPRWSCVATLGAAGVQTGAPRCARGDRAAKSPDLVGIAWQVLPDRACRISLRRHPRAMRRPARPTSGSCRGTGPAPPRSACVAPGESACAGRAQCFPMRVRLDIGGQERGEWGASSWECRGRNGRGTPKEGGASDPR
jgi:hypothetical protein